MKVATPHALPDGDNSSAGMRVSTAATMKACSVAVSVSSGSASGDAWAALAGAAVWAAAGPPVASAAVPTMAPLRKPRRGMVSSAIKSLPHAIRSWRTLPLPTLPRMRGRVGRGAPTAIIVRSLAGFIGSSETSRMLRKPNLTAQCRDEAFAFGEIVGPRRHRTPHRLRPCRIVELPRYDMNVELRHHIADRRNVEFVAGRYSLEGTRHHIDLGHELDLFGSPEVDDLARAGTPRHQQQPWVIAVAAQQQPRQRQVCNRHGILFELGMQRPLRQRICIVHQGVHDLHRRFQSPPVPPI